MQQGVDAFEQRGLARPVGSQQGAEAPLLHAKVDSLENRAVPIGEGKTVDLQPAHARPHLSLRIKYRNSGTPT